MTYEVANDRKRSANLIDQCRCRVFVPIKGTLIERFFFFPFQIKSSKVDTKEIDLSRFTKNFSARAKIAGARRFVVGSRWNSSSPVEYLSTFLFLFVAGRSNLNIRSFRVLHFSSARYSPSSHYL